MRPGPRLATTNWTRMMNVSAPAAMVAAGTRPLTRTVPRLVKRPTPPATKLLWTRMHRVAA